MTVDDLKVGHVYSAKRPARCGPWAELLNDRQVIWVGLMEVQYDSPTLANGRRYPRVSKEKFLAWAKADVTDQMPPNRDWRKAP